MATPVTLPALGESVTEGTVTRWLKEVGDDVEVDEPLLEVSTDKVDTEIPSPVAGKLLEIKAEEDETVEVGRRAVHDRRRGRVGRLGRRRGRDESDDSATTTATTTATTVTRTAPTSTPTPGPRRPNRTTTPATTTDDDEEKKTETETDPPAAKTDEEPAAQETAPSSSDTKPEAKASEKGTSGGQGGTPVTLPALGESVTEGTVTRWLKSVG